MAETKEQQRKQWPIYFYLLVPLVVALLTVAFIELVLTLFWPVPPAMATNMYYRADPITGFAHEPKAVGRYPTGIRAVANSRGLRDHEVSLEKPPNTRRILVLGDSFTVGVNVEMEDAYPQVLERMMNEASDTPIEIINAAVGGMDPFQYAQYFEHYAPDYSPDMVIVGFFVGNDTLSGSASVEQIATVVNGQRVSREAAQGNFVQLRMMLHQNFNLVRLLQGVSLINVPAIRQKCEDFSDNLLRIAQERLKNHRIDVNSHPRFSANAVNQIQRIKRKADAMGIPLVVVLIPDELQINQALRERVVEPENVPVYDFAMPQQLLTNEFEARGITTFDLLPFFLQDGRCLYMNDTHWTPEGHVFAASTLANYLARPASQRASIAAKAPVATKIPIEEAVSIIQSYVAVLQEHGKKNTSVLDSSLLPLPKEKIKAAAIALHSYATDTVEQQSIVGVAKSLALFQPDVGNKPIALEIAKPDGSTWRDVVAPEMQIIEQAFAESKR